MFGLFRKKKVERPAVKQAQPVIVEPVERIYKGHKVRIIETRYGFPPLGTNYGIRLNCNPSVWTHHSMHGKIYSVLVVDGEKRGVIFDNVYESDLADIPKYEDEATYNPVFNVPTLVKGG